MIKLILNSKETTFENVLKAVNFMAFEHYPLTVEFADKKEVFSSFDDAKDFLLSLDL